MPPTHAGTSGIFIAFSDATHCGISSRLVASVTTATSSGTTRNITRMTHIAATARLRLPASRRCMPIISGHVATTIIVAQTIARMNGRMIHSAATIISSSASTPSTVRGRSRSVVGMAASLEGR